METIAVEEVPFVLLALLTVLFVCFLPWLVFSALIT